MNEREMWNRMAAHYQSTLHTEDESSYRRLIFYGFFHARSSRAWFCLSPGGLLFMAKYILKRLVTVLLVLWAASTLTYFTVHVTPGDMVRAIVVQTYGEEYVNEEVLANVRTRFDLDKPVIEQYANWLWDIFHFDFGISYQYNMPVEQLLAARIPNTLKLGAVAFMLATLVGIPLGILSAIKQNKFFDHITRIFTLAAGSFPSFWIALMVIILFSLKLHWFPTSGMESANSIVLPALTLAIGMVATTTRMVRTSMLDVLRQDYMVVAKSKGTLLQFICHGVTI